MAVPTVESDPFVPKSGGQADFWNDWEHLYVALEGGWGAGKSFIGAGKLMYLHVQNAMDDKGNPTNVPSAAIAPTFPNARDYVVPAILDCCEMMNIPARWMSTHSNIVFPTLPLAEIKVRTADQPHRIAGWQVGAFWGDEAARWKEDRTNPRNDPITQIKGRLRHPNAAWLRQGLFTYTNEGDATRVYEEFHKEDADYAIYRARTADNDMVRHFYEEQLRNLTPELAEQYLEGKAVAFGGARAYKSFSTNGNVDEGLELKPRHPLALVLDFNIDPGMHAYLVQYIDGEFRIVYEIHAHRMDVQGAVTEMMRIVNGIGGWQWPELHIFGDATGKSEWAGTSESCYSILFNALKMAGLRDEQIVPRTPAANPPVSDRINAVNIALCDMNAERRIRVHPRCVKLIQDFERVRRDRSGKGLDKSNTSLTHGSDAIGYMVALLRPVRMQRDARKSRVHITSGV